MVAARENANGGFVDGTCAHDVMGGRGESAAMVVANGVGCAPIDSNGDAGGDLPAFGDGDADCQGEQAGCIGDGDG